MSSNPRMPQHVRHGDYQVICPYCGYEQEESYPDPNGDYGRDECQSCEKKFYSMAEINYSSKRDCELNGLKCNFVPDDEKNFFSDRKYDWFNCSECLETKLVKRSLEVGP